MYVEIIFKNNQTKNYFIKHTLEDKDVKVIKIGGSA